MPLLQTPAVQSLIHKYVGAPLPSVGSFGEAQMMSIPGTTEGSLEYQMGAKIPELLKNKQVLAPVANWIERAEGNPLRSGMLGAAAGAGGGALLGLLLQKDPRLAALLGAGAAGGGSWLAGTLMNMQRKRLAARGLVKPASFYGDLDSDPSEFISTRLAQDSGLSFSDKAQLSGMLNQLSQGQSFELARILRTITGAGVGALVAKFLFRLGIGGTILGSILGGVVGSRHGGNAIKRDVFGNARLFQ